MTTRETILDYVKNKYNTTPDFLWENLPGYATLKHKDGTWYGLIMDVPKSRLHAGDEGIVDVINLRSDPGLVE